MTQHLVELALAFTDEKLLEVHLRVVAVFKLLEEECAQADVDIQVGMLEGTLLEDHLHQLIEQTGRELEIVQKARRNLGEVARGQFVQQNPDLADDLVEFVFLSHWGLPRHHHAFLRRKVELSHVHRTLLVALLQAEDEFERVNVLRFLCAFRSFGARWVYAGASPHFEWRPIRAQRIIRWRLEHVRPVERSRIGLALTRVTVLRQPSRLPLAVFPRLTHAFMVVFFGGLRYGTGLSFAARRQLPAFYDAMLRVDIFIISAFPAVASTRRLRMKLPIDFRLLAAFSLKRLFDRSRRLPALCFVRLILFLLD